MSTLVDPRKYSVEIENLTLPDLLERGLSPNSDIIKSLHTSLEQFLGHHEKRLENCHRDKALSVDLKELGEPANLVRWAFPLRKEKLN
jgi:hypothetical protein